MKNKSEEGVGKGGGIGSIMTQFQPGESGNKKGRPKKGHAIADMIEAVGNELCPDPFTDPISGKEKKITNKEMFVRNTYKRAISGEKWAGEFIADRTEGKPRLPINVDSEGDRQIIELEAVALALMDNYTLDPRTERIDNILPDSNIHNQEIN